MTRPPQKKKITKQLKRNFRMKFSKLKIKQKFAVTWRALIQEKWMDLDENSELCRFLIYISPPTYSPAQQSSKIAIPIPVPERGEWSWIYFKALCPRSSRYLTYLVISWKRKKVFHYFTWLKIRTMLKATLGGGGGKKASFCKHLQASFYHTSACLEWYITTEANNKPTKKLKRKSWRMRHL